MAVEKTVVEEQQRIKDTEEFATADRQKQVTITLAEEQAQEMEAKQIAAMKKAREEAERAAAWESAARRAGSFARWVIAAPRDALSPAGTRTTP